jgi:hypothetical protein
LNQKPFFGRVLAQRSLNEKKMDIPALAVYYWPARPGAGGLVYIFSCDYIAQ